MKFWILVVITAILSLDYCPSLVEAKKKKKKEEKP